MALWRQSWKILLVVASVALFIIALKLMQAGAQAIAPLIKEHFEVETALGALGFGWCAAYVLLSGSPVAATAVTFLDGRDIDETAAFAMITGSRLGAAFVVLLIGVFYVLYHRQPARDLRMGCLALIVTASIYLPAFALGYATLEGGLFAGVLGAEANGLGEALEGGVVQEVEEKAEDLLPPWGTFLAGLVLIIGSFKLFDLSLPRMEADDGKTSRLRRFVYRRWPMFALGSLVTLVSMSVSVSLGLLVPLHERRIVRAEQVVPYIMGANIATFVDTLLASMTMERAGAMMIVLIEVGAVTIVSLLILVFVYRSYEKAVLALVEGIIARNRNLLAFAAFLVAVPLALLFLPMLGG